MVYSMRYCCADARVTGARANSAVNAQRHIFVVMRGIYCAAAGVALFGVACSDMGPKPYQGTTRRLMVAEATACALDPNGNVFCWGLNSNRWEYGAAPTNIAPSFIPVAVPVPRLASLAKGVGTHMCGITDNSKAVCWGRGGFGQLGGGVPGDSGNAATIVSGRINWRDLWVGRLDTCGVSIEGRGFCWGANQHGEVGVAFVSIEELTTSPIEVDGGFRFKQLIPGWIHACGITSADATYCWGANSGGQLGTPGGVPNDQRSPVRVDGGRAFAQLSLGAEHSCGLTNDGVAYCWGENSGGQLGDGTVIDRFVPTPVSTPLRFASIATASGFATGGNVAPPISNPPGLYAHTCALTSLGTPYCWGWNGNGQLGDGTTTTRLTPVPVAGNLTLSTIALGGAYTCGMQGNAVWCWGANAAGQLGRGSFSGLSTVPLRVGAPFDKP